MKQEASGLFSCSVASKAWLLRLSLVPSWLHYPLFQVVQALPAVFSSVCASTGLHRHTYGHLTATLSDATQHKRREARKGARHGVHTRNPSTQEARAEELRIQRQHELQYKAQEQKAEKTETRD